jgi:hypothetical protein
VRERKGGKNGKFFFKNFFRPVRAVAEREKYQPTSSPRPLNRFGVLAGIYVLWWEGGAISLEVLPPGDAIGERIDDRAMCTTAEGKAKWAAMLAESSRALRNAVDSTLPPPPGAAEELDRRAKEVEEIEIEAEAEAPDVIAAAVTAGDEEFEVDIEEDEAYEEEDGTGCCAKRRESTKAHPVRRRKKEKNGSGSGGGGGNGFEKKSRFSLSANLANDKAKELHAGDVWETAVYGRVVFVGVHQLLTTVYLSVLRQDPAKRSGELKSWTRIKAHELERKVEDRELLAKAIEFVQTRATWQTRWPGALEALQKRYDGRLSQLSPLSPQPPPASPEECAAASPSATPEVTEDRAPIAMAVQPQQSLLPPPTKQETFIEEYRTARKSSSGIGVFASGEVWNTSKFGPVAIVGFILEQTTSKSTVVVVRRDDSGRIKVFRSLRFVDLLGQAVDNDLLSKAIDFLQENRDFSAKWPGAIGRFKKMLNSGENGDTQQIADARRLPPKKRKRPVDTPSPKITPIEEEAIKIESDEEEEEEEKEKEEEEELQSRFSLSKQVVLDRSTGEATLLQCGDIWHTSSLGKIILIGFDVRAGHPVALRRIEGKGELRLTSKLTIKALLVRTFDNEMLSAAITFLKSKPRHQEVWP